jgi:hypothetical protein
MRVQLHLIILMLGCLFPQVGECANIIWVADTFDESGDGIQDDQTWVDILEEEGHTVTYTKANSQGDGYWRTLDDAKIAALNTADLVIVSRCSASGAYSNDNESRQWNSVKTPLILLNAYFSRRSKWAWIDTLTPRVGGPGYRDKYTPALCAVVADHPIFKDLPLNEKKQVTVFDPSVGSGAVSFNELINVGNGTLIAKASDKKATFIAEWKAGKEFYTGSGQTPAGHRMLFAAGAMELPQNGCGRGEYNLNSHGKKIYFNIIEYMLDLKGDGSSP